jgi:addiction module HigA family antidote
MKRIRKPTHPGKILKEFYLNELGTTITEFAEHIEVSRKAISAIVNEHKSVTPEMAIRFAAAFPNSTPESWINLQRNYDLWCAGKSLKKEISHITPVVAHAC